LSLTNISNGIHGNGLDFDGVDDSVNVGEDFNFSGTNHFTISSWINTNGYKTSSILSRYNTSVGGAREVSFYMLDSNITLLRECDTFNLYTNYVPPLGEWVNVVFRFDGSYMALYVNGEFYQQKLLDCSVPSVSSDVLIGSLQTGADYTYSFNGSIDEVMIFNRSLSVDEISALYNSKINKFNSTFTGLSSGEHNYSVYAIDSSGNLNISDERNFIVGEDTTPPQFTTIPSDDSINYSDDWAGVDFDATDETSFGSYSVNDTRFTINSTGFLDDVSTLGVEVYSLNITINDTTGNENSTVYTLTVNQATGSGTLYIDNSANNKSVVVNSNVELNGTLDVGVGDIYLYVNDTLYESGSSPLYNISNFTTEGYYEIKLNYSGNTNYTSFEEILYLNITSAPDTTSPTYSLNQTNSTAAGKSVKFSLYVNDDFGLESNGQYIFSTNNTGVWANDSAVNFTATPSWANVTKTLNSTLGISVGYRWYLTDNAGNSNNTGIFVLNTTTMTDIILPTILSINSPLNKSYTTTNNILFNITATDDVEVSACVYSFNEGTTNYTLSNSGGDYWTTTRSSMSNGLYGVRFYCVDSSDNWNFSSRLYFTVNYDSGDTSPGGGSPSLTTTTTLPDISVSPSTINLDVGLYTTKVAFILVTNEGDDILNLSITENNLGKRVILPSDYEVVVPGETKALEFIFVGLNDTGVYTGTISIGGKAIPVSLNIKELNLLFDSNIVVLNKAYIVRQGDKLKTSVELIPMGDPARLDVTLNYAIKDYEDNIYLTRSETVLVEDRMKFNRDFDTGILPVGKYVVALELIYPNGVAPSSAHFEIIEWIPTTFFGRLVFYIVNAILIILIVIISIIIRNLVVRIKRNKK